MSKFFVFSNNNDIEVQSLKDALGDQTTRSLNDLQFEYLRGLGFVGSLTDMLLQFSADIPDSLVTEVVSGDVTFTFSEPVEAGTYATGGAWYVGDATVTDIDPPFAVESGTFVRDGSSYTNQNTDGAMLNPGKDDPFRASGGSIVADQGWVSWNISGEVPYLSTLNVDPAANAGDPVVLSTGDVLVKALVANPPWSSRYPVEKMESLHKVSVAPSSTAFRPGQSDTSVGANLTHSNLIDMSLLPSIPATGVPTKTTILNAVIPIDQWLTATPFSAESIRPNPTQTDNSFWARQILWLTNAIAYLCTEASSADKRDVAKVIAQYAIDSKARKNRWDEYGNKTLNGGGHDIWRFLVMDVGGYLLGQSWGQELLNSNMPRWEFGQIAVVGYQNLRVGPWWEAISDDGRRPRDRYRAENIGQSYFGDLSQYTGPGPSGLPKLGGAYMIGGPNFNSPYRKQSQDGAIAAGIWYLLTGQTDNIPRFFLEYVIESLDILVSGANINTAEISSSSGWLEDLAAAALDANTLCPRPEEDIFDIYPDGAGGGNFELRVVPHGRNFWPTAIEVSVDNGSWVDMTTLSGVSEALGLSSASTPLRYYPNLVNGGVTRQADNALENGGTAAGWPASYVYATPTRVLGGRHTIPGLTPGANHSLRFRFVYDTDGASDPSESVSLTAYTTGEWRTPPIHMAAAWTPNALDKVWSDVDGTTPAVVDGPVARIDSLIPNTHPLIFESRVGSTAGSATLRQTGDLYYVELTGNIYARLATSVTAGRLSVYQALQVTGNHLLLGMTYNNNNSFWGFAQSGSSSTSVYSTNALGIISGLSVTYVDNVETAQYSTRGDLYTALSGSPHVVGLEAFALGTQVIGDQELTIGGGLAFGNFYAANAHFYGACARVVGGKSSGTGNDEGLGATEREEVYNWTASTAGLNSGPIKIVDFNELTNNFNTSLAVPIGAAEPGDLRVIVAARQVSEAAIVDPSGWTNATNYTAANGPKLSISYKEVTTSEASGTASVSSAGTGSFTCQSYVLRALNRPLTVGNSGVAATAPTTTHTTPTVTATADSLILQVLAYRTDTSSGFTHPATPTLDPTPPVEEGQWNTPSGGGGSRPELRVALVPHGPSAGTTTARTSTTSTNTSTTRATVEITDI